MHHMCIRNFQAVSGIDCGPVSRCQFRDEVMSLMTEAPSHIALLSGSHPIQPVNLTSGIDILFVGRRPEYMRVRNRVSACALFNIAKQNLSLCAKPFSPIPCWLFVSPNKLSSAYKIMSAPLLVHYVHMQSIYWLGNDLDA